MVKTGMHKRALLLSFAGLLAACAQPKGPRTAVAVPASGGGAQAAFEAALRGYEQENLKPLEALLPPRFIGRGLLLDAARNTLNEQKQIRITLAEARVAGSADGAQVTLLASWDKRFLKWPGLTPAAESGALQALLRLEAGQWQLESLSADNPFTR